MKCTYKLFHEVIYLSFRILHKFIRERIDYIGMRALIEEEDNDSNADAKDVDVLQGFDYRTIIRESLTLEDLVTTQFIFLNVTVYISWVAMISGSMRSRSSLYCRIYI